jgi:HSP20 family protein
VAVKGGQARASYRSGVLKVELPKLTPGQPSVTQTSVS